MFGHKSDPARIYAYGAKAPVENADLVGEQMFKAHRYRNELVAFERERRDRIDAALVRLSPHLAQTEADLVQAEADVEKAVGALKAAQGKARKKVRPAPLVSAVTAAKKARKTLWDQRKQLRAALFGKRAPKNPQNPRALRPWLVQPDPQWLVEEAAINTWHKAEEKRLRATNDLYWGTYLHVEQAMGNVKQGPPPQFQSWRGDGHLAVQIQGGLPAPELFGGSDTRIRVDPVPAAAWQPGGRALRRTRVWLRVGSDGRAPIWAVVPVVLHRPLPDDAKVKWVHLIRRRVATHDEWRVSFVLTRESGWAKTDCASEGTVGIDVGWRVRPDGLRVAYWAGSDGAEGELVLPQAVVDGWQKVCDLRSIRDLHFNTMRVALVAWLKGAQAPAWLQQETQTLAQWRSPARLAKLTRQWRDARFAGDAVALPEAAEIRSTMQLDPAHYGTPVSIYDLLEAWRKKNRHLYDWERNQELKLQRRREDLYRNFAATMRRSYRTIVIESLDLRDFHVLPQAEEPSANGAMREHTRTACLSFLLRCLKESAANLVGAQAEYTTMDCHVCNHREDFDRMNLFHTCGSSAAGGCGALWDQDQNAARNLLKQGPSGAAGAAGTPSGTGAGASPPAGRPQRKSAGRSEERSRPKRGKDSRRSGAVR